MDTAREDGVVGTIEALWRHPVKSMQGEQVLAAAVTPDGLAGDRSHAVCDATTGRLLSAKSVPDLLLASARMDEDGTVQIVLPGGDELRAGDPATDDALSAWLGRPVALRERGSVGASAYEMTFDPPNDEAEMVVIPTMPTRLFDLATLHVLSTASLDRLEAMAPGHQWDVRRFRPNVVVRSAEAHVEGFVDEAWVDRSLTTGSGVRLLVQMKTVRCAMPLREQPALARDAGIYRALDELCANHLGVYVEVVGSGTLSVGDDLTVVGG